jgi:hypothetical protein
MGCRVKVTKCSRRTIHPVVTSLGIRNVFCCTVSNATQASHFVQSVIVEIIVDSIFHFVLENGNIV